MVFCPAIDFQETDTELILNIKITEVKTESFQVDAEPTSISIKTAHPRQQKDKITFQLLSLVLLATQEESSPKSEIKDETAESLLQQQIIENCHKQLECYFSLPTIINTQEISLKLINEVLIITVLKSESISPYDMSLAKLYW